MSTAQRSEDWWQRHATDRAIGAARKIATSGATVPPDTPVGRLSDTEWGWIFSAMLFAWLSARSEQATAEGRNIEQAIRSSNPDAWDAGAVADILPDLATIDIDWKKPMVDWPRETMIAFLLKALDLARTAMAVRDLAGGVTRQSSPDRIAREANAAAGGPLVIGNELNDPLPQF
jgi:hypothetical protein